MIKISLLLVALLLLAACDTAPQPNVNAAASNLASAQAQATITSGDATRAAASANAQLQQQYQQATQQAQAQQSAQQDKINSLMIAQAQTNATADAHIKQAAIQSAWLEVTKQAQPIQATAIAVQALAAKTAKDTSDALATADLNNLLSNISKIALVLALIGGIIFLFLLGIVALRKWQQKDQISQPHPDGPAFYFKHGLLSAPDPFVLWNPIQEQFKYSLELRDPPPLLTAGGNDYHEPIKVTVNGQSSYVQPMTHAEARMRAYWKARVMRFLDDAIAVSGPDAQKIPRFDKMQVKSGDWVETTNTLLPHIFKEGRQPTLCLPPYESLSLLRDAVASGAITPLPQQVTLPKEETQGDTDNRETGENSEKQRTTEDNRADPVVLHGAVSSLPDWGGKYTPPKPPAPKKAGLLRRVMDAAK